ncbi:MAG: SIS domain-containing protein [bacterium]|nr:SIS domain-containing protein [bacterium]
MREWLSNYIAEHTRVIQSLDQDAVVSLIEMVKDVRSEDHQIFVIGNGGSAACSGHLAVDLGKGASFGKEKRFRVFSPVDNVSWLTAIANDLSYEDIFSEQIENFASPGDLLLAISVSGSSPNLVKAVDRAKSLGLKTSAIVGDKNGILINMVDHVIIVPSRHYGHVEDIHTAICHMIAYYFIEEVRS